VSFPVTFDPAARTELFAAADFYDLEHPSLGSEFLDAVYDGLSRVAEHPGSAPIALGETRKLVLDRFPYSIMYWIDRSGVVVSAVAHHSRRPFYWGDRA
jgi:plasmid stabilization system protein ParE